MTPKTHEVPSSMARSEREIAQKFNFTRRALERIPVPQEQRAISFDRGIAGLGFMVFPSGVRSFFHRRWVRGTAERTTLGRFPEMSIEQAREEAGRLNAAIAKWKLSGYRGESPFHRPLDEITFGALVEDYIERHVKGHAAHPGRATQEVRWAVDRHLAPWKATKLGDLTRADMVRLHRDIGEKHKTSANRTIELVRRLYNWAASPDVNLYRGENPALHIKRFHEARRTRFLRPDEIAMLFAALKKEPNTDLVDFVNLALWTG